MKQKDICSFEAFPSSRDVLRNHGNRKAVGLGILLSIVAVTLAGCLSGGGGGGSTSATPAPTPSATPSTNQVELAINNGIYQLWGFNYIVNGVPQVYVSHTDVAWSRSKIYGAVSSFETPPGILDGLPTASTDYFPALTTGTRTWIYPTNSSQAILTNPSWTVTLNQQDISGQTVLSQIKKADGSLLSPTLANASTIFPTGSIAYTATYVASSNMVLPFSTTIGVTSEAALNGNGACSAVTGQTNRLGVYFNTGNVVSIFSEPNTTCNPTGLTAIATGTWAKTISASGDTIYTITYPASITSGIWASAVSHNGYSPWFGLPDFIINPAGTTNYYWANNIPAGSSYTSLQPFFNSVALPALRSAAGI